MERIKNMFGLDFPVFQGGMANVATGEFAAAVSNAGAMGIIGSGGMDAEQLQNEIRNCRKATNRPFGVNIMLMNPHADDLADLCCEEGVSLITTGAGNPGKYIEKWQRAGIKIFPVVSSTALAIRMERLGVDGIIAEGYESGGHVGELTTMVLVPQVADAVSIPVVAAGGIAGGKQILAARILGACGVQMGTVFLASSECPVHEEYKKAVLRAKSNDTVVTGRSVNAPVRIIKNQMAREYLKRERAGAQKDELEQFTLGSLGRAVREGDVKYGSLMAGQVSGMIREIKPVREILVQLFEEYDHELKELCEKA